MTFIKSVMLSAFALGLVCVLAPATRAQRVRVIGGSTPRVETPSRASRDLGGAELSIHNLINAERRKRGVGDLEWNEELARVAREYSKKMAREGFFDHRDDDGNSVVDRVTKARISGWSRIGENLYYSEGYDSFEAMSVRGWMKSPGHRENLLDRRYTSAGIGVARSRDGKIYVTQVFMGR